MSGIWHSITGERPFNVPLWRPVYDLTIFMHWLQFFMVSMHDCFDSCFLPFNNCKISIFFWEFSSNDENLFEHAYIFFIIFLLPDLLQRFSGACDCPVFFNNLELKNINLFVFRKFECQVIYNILTLKYETWDRIQKTMFTVDICVICWLRMNLDCVAVLIISCSVYSLLISCYFWKSQAPY